jgi:hypothetical protein
LAYFLMVTGSAGMGELGSRLSVGQHSLFFLSAATVLSAGAAAPEPGQRGSRTVDAEQTGNPSN